MLQHINLMPHDDEPMKRVGLGASQVWLYSFVVSLAFMGLIIWSYVDYQNLQKEADKSEHRFQQLMSQYEVISEQLVEEVGDEGADGTAEKLIETIAQQKTLLAILEDRYLSSEDITPFSQWIALIVSHEIAGLDIEAFAVAQGGYAIMLQGRTERGAAVTQYIDYLQTQAPFKNQLFTLVSLSEKPQSGRVDSEGGKGRRQVAQDQRSKKLYFQISSHQKRAVHSASKERGQVGSGGELSERQQRSIGDIYSEVNRYLLY